MGIHGLYPIMVAADHGFEVGIDGNAPGLSFFGGAELKLIFIQDGEPVKAAQLTLRLLANVLAHISRRGERPLKEHIEDMWCIRKTSDKVME